VRNLSPPSPRPPRTALYLAAILIVAFVARTGFAWDQERKIPREALAVVPFAQEAGSIAYSLATGKGFSSPFRNDTGPTAWLPPVYPFLLSLIFRVFGPVNIPSLHAAVLLNILFSTGTCVPIFFAGKRLGGSSSGIAVAITAASSWALLPAAVLLPFEWIWDTSLSALLAALLLWATFIAADSHRYRDWCAYGLLGGFALLTNTALAALLLPWLLWAGFVAARNVRKITDDRAAANPLPKGAAWKRPALALSAAILCCLPWTIRNYIQFHQLIPVRSNFAFELWTGNNNIFDPHTGNAMARITIYGEVRQYTQLGETAYMHEKYQKAILFIRTHPQLVAKLILARVVATWLGTQHPFNDFAGADSWLPRAVFLLNGLFLLGTIAGIILLYSRGNRFAFPLAAAPVLFPLVYYVTHTSLRYRHPLDPILVLLTAVSAVALVKFFLVAFRPAVPATTSPTSAAANR
jgi:dolichyl-phosphate-mannose-protein mannosyltransferase